MSNISSSVGLISGLPIGELVEGLLAQQKRPITLLENRISGITTLRTALLDLSARLLALKGKSDVLKSAGSFTSAAAASSDETLLRATASSGASVGTYSFLVRQLAAGHQVVSNSFLSSGNSFLNPGKLIIDNAAARLDRSTALNTLRGGQGIRGGVIRVTDRSGSTGEIDLTAARSVEDVLGAINGQTRVNVRARVSGDRIVLEDQTGLSTGSLVVADVSGGHAAEDFGLVGSGSTGVLNGSDVVFLGNRLRLDQLNDGTGIRRGNAGADFRLELADGSALDIDLSGRLTGNTSLSLLNGGAGVAGGVIHITNRAGQSADVDLSGATTAGDVVATINASGIGVTANYSGSGFTLTDASIAPEENAGTLTVTDVGGGVTARDLGLTTAASGASLKGASVYRVETLGDVLNVINRTVGNGGRVTASISADGDRILLADQTSGPGELNVVTLNNSNAALDLGLLRPTGGAPTIESSRLLAGLDTVLLRTLAGGLRNGGAEGGVQTGVIRITSKAGTSAEVDLTGVESLGEAIEAINASGVGVTAAISESGLGLVLTDASGGTGNLVVEDVTGGGAAALGITYNGTGSTVRNANLQRRYLSEATRLDQFDLGAALPRGKFRITNATGQSAVVDLTQGTEITVADLLAEINSRGINVTARINDGGDGILLTDNSAGAGVLTVAEEEGGSIARTLRLLGKAEQGKNTLDGSFETALDISATDTLDTLSTRLAAANAGVNISVINDGTPGGGYRVTLTSRRSGIAGRFAVDGDAVGLSFSTLTRGRDAVLQIGGADSAPLIITSSTNTIENAIGGVKLDLLGTGTKTVDVTVTRDVDAIVTRMSDLAEAFNGVLSRISDLSGFDPDSGQRGVLLGDRTADQVGSQVSRLLTRQVAGLTGRYSRLSAAGFGFSNGQFSFNEAKFRAAFEEDPEAIEALFTQAKTGLATLISDTANSLSNSDGSLIARRDETLNASAESLTQRKTQLEDLLEKRRLRLEAQFFATEQLLSKLQSQQTALNSLSTLAGSFSSTKKSTQK